VAVLLVPREQVRTVLDERIRAGKELDASADLAEKANGYGDWIYLFAKWREHTMAELKVVYAGDDIPHEFDIATNTTERSN
jgi:hypothetical protein